MTFTNRLNVYIQTICIQIDTQLKKHAHMKTHTPMHAHTHPYVTREKKNDC